LTAGIDHHCYPSGRLDWPARSTGLPIAKKWKTPVMTEFKVMSPEAERIVLEMTAVRW